MKKFYTLLFSAIIAVASVSAATFQLQKDNAVKNRLQSRMQGVSVADFDMSGMSKSIKSNEINPADISGTYLWSYISNLSIDVSSPFKTLDIAITKSSDSEYVVDMGGFKVSATYDGANLTMETEQFLGHDDNNNVDVYFYHGRWDENSNLAFLDTPLVGTVGNTSITFDENDVILLGLKGEGWFAMAYSNTFTISETTETWVDEFMPADGWSHFDTATFVDPWVMSGFGVDIEENAYTVEVEKHETETELYRIVNPYGASFPCYALNEDTEAAGYIVFSLADPEFVMVYPHIYSGFTVSEYGSFLCTNPEGFFSMLYGASKAEILQNLNITPSSYSEGVVTLRNCRFGYISVPDKLIGWENVSPVGRISFDSYAAISDIDADAVDAQPEYYNLQGMRVMDITDAKGLYIRKQGNKSVKVVLK